MKIAYEPLDTHSLENILIGMSDNFATRESMSKALKIKSRELQTLFSPLIQGSFDHSYVVKDLETNNIIGGIVCNDLIFFMNAHFSHDFSPELESILSLISELEHNFIGKHHDLIKERSYLYQFAIYVDEKFKGKGIGMNLLKLSEESAKKKKFKKEIFITFSY